MTNHHTIQYAELAAHDMEATKEFFTLVFGWQFTMWGEDYMDCTGSGLGIGFYRAELCSLRDKGGALIGIFSEDLEASQQTVEKHGGRIVEPIFSFPGGRRFHFAEPSGNEFSVFCVD